MSPRHRKRCQHLALRARGLASFWTTGSLLWITQKCSHIISPTRLQLDIKLDCLLNHPSQTLLGHQWVLFQRNTHSLWSIQSYMTFPGLHKTVNDHSDPEAFMSTYASFSDVVAPVIKHGVGTLSAKMDLTDVFKLRKLLPALWTAHLSGLVEWVCQCPSVCHACEPSWRSNTLPGWLLHCWPSRLPSVCQQHQHHDCYM